MDLSLEDRIRRLERANRRLKLLGVLLGLTAVTCGSGVTSNFALVRTARLDIVDEAETVHLSLGARGGAHISFSDAEGTVQLDAGTLRSLLRSTAGEQAPRAP